MKTKASVVTQADAMWTAVLTLLLSLCVSFFTARFSAPSDRFAQFTSTCVERGDEVPISGWSSIGGEFSGKRRDVTKYPCTAGVEEKRDPQWTYSGTFGGVEIDRDKR